jgi:hypothetical protein
LMSLGVGAGLIFFGAQKPLRKMMDHQA